MKCICCMENISEPSDYEKATGMCWNCAESMDDELLGRDEDEI
jgi:hypothetical protein